MAAQGKRVPPVAVTTLAIALLIAVAPAARWLAGVQVQTLFGSPSALAWLMTDQAVRDTTLASNAGIAADLRQAAADRPNDVGVQVALALQEERSTDPAADGRLAALRRLAARMPDAAAVRAAYIRVASGYRFPSRPEEAEMEPDRGASSRPAAADAGERAPFAEIVEQARIGARLEPANGFFPAMAAAGLLQLGKDAAALQTLARAAGCPTWDDYAMGEVEGRLKLQGAAFGRLPASYQAAALSSPASPHLARIRSATRVAVALAGSAEAAGNKAAGLAIRDHIMRLAGHIRANSRTAEGTLAGCAMTGIALTRPGGAAAGKGSTGADRLKRFAAYATKAGDPALAKRAAARMATADAVRGLCVEGAAKSPLSATPALLAAAWAVGIIVAGNVLWVILLSAGNGLVWRMKLSTQSAQAALIAGVVVAAGVAYFQARGITGLAQVAGSAGGPADPEAASGGVAGRLLSAGALLASG
ncbi:MAG: hypothetical protein NT029_17650, partial [Armatimonadetes bacterium]|nr:hypothetical protein [Armatimonadota bacterium]